MLPVSLEGKLTRGRVPAVHGGVVRSLPLPYARHDLFNCCLGGGVSVCFFSILLLLITARPCSGILPEGSRQGTDQFGDSNWEAACLQVSISLERSRDLSSRLRIFLLRTVGQSAAPHGVV